MNNSEIDEFDDRFIQFIEDEVRRGVDTAILTNGLIAASCQLAIDYGGSKTPYQEMADYMLEQLEIISLGLPKEVPSRN